MDSGKPHLAPVTHVGPINGTLEMAEVLEKVAAGLRDGSIDADSGVLVMASRAKSLLFPPKRLGGPTRATDLLGLLSYAQARVYDDEIRDA